MTDSELIAAFERLELRLVALEKKMATGTTSAKGGEVADVADLDGKYGDEDLRKMPSAKYWKGVDFTGRKMSETTAEFLDAFAKYKDACAYMNEKSGDAEKAKYIGYDRKSARRARGWAARIRDGKVKPATASGGDLLPPGDDDIPF